MLADCKLEIDAFHESYRIMASGCWMWISTIDVHGYGSFIFGGKKESAHRASYRLAHGVIPHPLLVLPCSSSRKCVNPEHLRLGTHADIRRTAWRLK